MTSQKSKLNLVDNEVIIREYKHRVQLYINTEEYLISKPLGYINPLWIRILDGRGWKNNILRIYGSLFITNYRITFVAKQDNFSLFSLPHDLGNSIKNRLYGKIDIPLIDVISVSRFFSPIRLNGLDIYVKIPNGSVKYKFQISFINLLELVKDINLAQGNLTGLKTKPFISTHRKLLINQRLEKHNIFWIRVHNFLWYINALLLPLVVYNIVDMFSYLKSTIGTVPASSTHIITTLNFYFDLPFLVLKPIVFLVEKITNE